MMGLKVHLVFISMASHVLAFASWSVWMYEYQGPGGCLAVAVSAAVGLVVYGGWFLKKMKGLHTP
jgi:hypothetical protein